MATKFIGLYDKDATKTLSGNATTSWKWTLPTNLNARQSPLMKVSVAAGYLDDSYGTVIGYHNASEPRMLRIKVYSESYLQKEKTSTVIYPIMSIPVRDAFVGHWLCPQAPHQIDIELSTQISQLEFDFVDFDGNVLETLSGATVGGIFNMVLKLEYPEHNEVRDNTVMSYAQSQIGNPPFNRL